MCDIIACIVVGAVCLWFLIDEARDDTKPIHAKAHLCEFMCFCYVKKILHLNGKKILVIIILLKKLYQASQKYSNKSLFFFLTILIITFAKHS